MDEVRKKFGDLAKDEDDLVLCALYPVTGKRFLKWKYGLEEIPEEMKPKTMEQVKKEAEIVRKALAGELTSKKSNGNGRELEVTVDGETFTVEINDPNAVPGPSLPQIRRKKKAGIKEVEKTGSLTAPLPGMIVEYKKAVGDKVNAGETLVVIEAMKMMNNIDSTVDGVVKEVKFEASDSVSKGDVIMVIEPSN
jgi:biotin carboxyl carrier protein